MIEQTNIEEYNYTDQEQLSNVIDENLKQIDTEYLQELKGYKLLYFENNSKLSQNSTYKRYSDCFRWDIEALNQIPLTNDVDRDSLINLLTLNTDRPNSEIVKEYQSKPATVLTAMTLFTYNYDLCIHEITDNINNSLDNGIHNFDNMSVFIPTDIEERTLFVGRHLLKQINEEYKDQYISNLIRDLDGVILNFALGFVKQEATRLNLPSMYKDLVQEGSIGILKALGNYDVNMDLKFLTYAGYWVKREMGLYNRRHSETIRVPFLQIQGSYRIKKVKDFLTKDLNREPSYEEILSFCKENNIKLANYLCGKEFPTQIKAVGWITDVKENLDDLKIDTIPEEEIDYDYLILRSELEDIFTKAQLSPRETRIIKMMFGIIQSERTNKVKYSFEEIGKKLGITRQRVQQLQDNALKKLRLYLSANSEQEYS